MTIIPRVALPLTPTSSDEVAHLIDEASTSWKNLSLCVISNRGSGTAFNPSTILNFWLITLPQLVGGGILPLSAAPDVECAAFSLCSLR